MHDLNMVKRKLIVNYYSLYIYKEMELENYYYKNLKKLFLSKFNTQDLVVDINSSFISF